MRVLVDMNLTHRWVDYLSGAGFDAVHWSSFGAATAKDQELCDYAREHVYVLLTNDLDFPRILAHTRQAAPSIILLRGEPLVPEARGRAPIHAIEECRMDLDRGAILTLDWTGRPPARVLPLR
jgi:predicted nuclease of predicted toxin-antitoxin system